MGFVYLYSRYGRAPTFDGDQNWAQRNPDGTWFIEKIYFEWKEEYGFHKTYLFLNLGIEMDYRLYDFLHFSFSGGYMHGFRTMGYLRGWYTVVDEPRVDLKSSTKGSNYYITAGVQLHFKPVKIDFERDVIQRKYNINAGISTLFEWVSLKNYVSDFNIYLGPSFSISTGRLSTELSVLYTS